MVNIRDAGIQQIRSFSDLHEFLLTTEQEEIEIDPVQRGELINRMFRLYRDLGLFLINLEQDNAGHYWAHKGIPSYSNGNGSGKWNAIDNRNGLPQILDRDYLYAEWDVERRECHGRLPYITNLPRPINGSSIYVDDQEFRGNSLLAALATFPGRVISLEEPIVVSTYFDYQVQIEKLALCQTCL